jgi:hypothetical protein
MSSSEEISTSTEVIASETALSTTLDSEAVILEKESGMYYGLNDVATIIWESLDERRTVSDLRDVVLAEYDVDPERVQEDVESVLVEMESNGLVEFGQDR